MPLCEPNSLGGGGNTTSFRGSPRMLVTSASVIPGLTRSAFAGVIDVGSGRKTNAATRANADINPTNGSVNLLFIVDLRPCVRLWRKQSEPFGGLRSAQPTLHHRLLPLHPQQHRQRPRE